MTIAEMKDRKKELGYTNRMISEKTGVPFGTVQKIFSGATTAPRRETILALEKLLSASGKPARVREPSAPYDTLGSSALNALEKTQSYTLEDYLALPDDLRVELIDGVFYDLAAPSTLHQSIALFIGRTLLDHVTKNKGPCYPFVSPIDVQLDNDEKTVVQPDVLVVCDRCKYKDGRVFGAPDLIIEILSPSTREKDMFLKYYKYARAGVREYWMVDPEKKTIVQYDLANMEPPSVFRFDEEVPVLIWKGRCVIDFRELSEKAAFLWDVQ